jgi:hypothetical protein
VLKSESSEFAILNPTLGGLNLSPTFQIAFKNIADVPAVSIEEV